MSSYVGLDDFCQFSVGTGATAPFGNIQGGSIGANEGSFKHVEGAGGQDDIIWDLVKPSASIKTVYKGEALLTNCQRTVWNGLPPQIHIWGGVLDDSVARSYKQTGYVNGLEIACGAVGDPVEVNYDVLSMTNTLATAGTANVATAAATAPFVWHAGAATINAVAMSCRAFSVKLENGMSHDADLDAKASGSQRLPDQIDPGNEVVTARFTVAAPPTLNFAQDTPTLPINASVVISNGYTTKTLTLTGLYIKPFGAELLKGGGDKHTWELDCEAKLNTLKSAVAQALAIA